MENAFLGGWLAGSATVAVTSIVVFAIAYYAKPYIDKKIRAVKINRAKNKKVVQKKDHWIKRYYAQFKKHRIPFIVLGVISIILYVVFTSYTASSETVAWWIIGIVSAILIGIILFKFKHGIKIPSMSTGTSTASASTPASSKIVFGSKVWKVCGCILACAVVLGWCLKHPGKHSTDTFTVPSPKVWADDAADLQAPEGYLHAGANELVAGTFYHFDRVANKEYSFYTKDGVRIVNITANDNDDEFGSFRADTSGSRLITLDQPFPTHPGLYKVNVDTTATIFMKVRKK